jgi:hypothetical protein
MNGQPHAPAALSPGKAHGTHWISCVDPKAGQDDMENLKLLNLRGLELRSLCHPTRCHSLYRLLYCGSLNKTRRNLIENFNNSKAIRIAGFMDFVVFSSDIIIPADELSPVT